MDAKELPHFLSNIEVYIESTITRIVIKLMALTLLRTKELVGARWSELDLEAAHGDKQPGNCRSTQSNVSFFRQEIIVVSDVVIWVICF